MQATSFDCPNCGASVATLQKICDYCDSPVVITSLSSISHLSRGKIDDYLTTYNSETFAKESQADLSKGICYLKLKQYDKAIAVFDKIITKELDHSEAYFYSGIAHLKGKNPYKFKRSEIENIVYLFEAACELDKTGLYHYFLAYVKYDFHYRRFISVSPSYRDELSQAHELGYSISEVDLIFELLGVEPPRAF